MNIGIYFTNESRESAEQIFIELIQTNQIVNQVHDSYTNGMSCQCKNGDYIRMIRANESARGYRSDIAYVPENIDEQLFNEIIRPKVFGEIKFYKPKKKCSFCTNHEKGDTLYEMSDWDGGIGFDYIHNIKYCPLCGKELR